MKTNTRREFLKKSTTGLASAVLLSQFPAKLIAFNTIDSERPIGFQSWTLRKDLVNDFPGTLKMMAGLGYSDIEMCSPLGYSLAGFAPLNKMKGSEMKKIIEDSGLRCISSHFLPTELHDHLEDRIEWAHEMGLTQMILSTFMLPRDASADDYRKAADDLNEIAVKIKEAGIQMGYHNHHMEFEKRGDELIYDALLDEFDPDLVKMQFQVAVINIGYKAADYFRNYPGRFISAHLADWSAEKEEQVPVGQGVVDWNDFFEAASIGGVKNFYVEMDPEAFKPSIDFLKSI